MTPGDIFQILISLISSSGPASKRPQHMAPSRSPSFISHSAQSTGAKCNAGMNWGELGCFRRLPTCGWRRAHMLLSACGTPEVCCLLRWLGGALPLGHPPCVTPLAQHPPAFGDHASRCPPAPCSPSAALQEGGGGGGGVPGTAVAGRGCDRVSQPVPPRRAVRERSFPRSC